MTDSQLTTRQRMENKTSTPIPEFKEVTKTRTDEQILAESYSISQSISNIIIKKYSRLMKGKAAKIIIFILLSMIIYGCVTFNVNITPNQIEKKSVENPGIDTSDCNSRWYFQF